MFKFVEKKWLIFWGILYLLVLVFGIFFPKTYFLSFWKLLGIFSCFIYAFLRSPRDKLLCLALGITFISDLALDRSAFNIGVLTFCFAQLFHFLRMNPNPLVTRFYALGAACLLLIGLIVPQEFQIFVFGAVYAITLVSNLILTKTKELRIGFSLFVACDLCVALSFCTGLGILPAGLMVIFDYLAWVFYLPSQIIISQSEKMCYNDN